MQIGITVIGVLTGYLGGEALGEAFAGWIQGLMPGFAYAGNIGTALAVSLITFITLIFGELVPKRLALTRSEAIAGLVAMPMSWLASWPCPSSGCCPRPPSWCCACSAWARTKSPR